VGNALPSVKAVNAPLICSEFDSRVETIESSRLSLNTCKPGCVGTSVAKEVKYLAELAALVVGDDRDTLRTQPPIFVTAFRQVGWNPRLFDRSYFGHTRPVPCGDERILQQANQTWRQLVTNQPAPTLDSALWRELDRIVTASKKELLAA
jgi:trimethylamine:corrinoid methyltransferase-like protein